jgi:pyrimidine 5'-nucleotidase
MNVYMLEKLHLPLDKIASLRRFYFETYGTTLRGLQTHYHIDADDFLAFVHDLPIRKMVQPDPELRELLLSLQLRKFIFTNADSAHAGRILDALELQGCFDGIIDVRRLNFHCKPEPVVYQMALDVAGESNPQRCIYLDDSPRNLAPARPMGFFTILVGDESNTNAADRAIHRLHDLPQVMPELWQDHYEP